MSQKRRLSHSHRSRGRRKTSPVIFKFQKHKSNLPQFVTRVHDAVEKGHTAEAVNILRNENAQITNELQSNEPSRVNTMFVMAEVFFLIGKYNNAEKLCRDILTIGPNALVFNFGLVFNMLGGICENTGRISETITYLKKTTRLIPDFAGAWSNLGMAMIRIGEIGDGVDLLRKAVEKNLKLATLRSNFLLYLNYLPDVDSEELFNEHKQWGRLHATVNLAKTSHSNVPEPDRKLRIGYISSDFRTHPVSYFFEPLLERHNRNAVEVYGYSNVQRPDQTTERLKSKFDHYRNICGVNDKMVVNMIGRDQIDILVDLNGHTDNTRLTVLAYKPAPIQVTYLGYSNTTGMQQIDYRLTDSLSNSPDSQRFYTEELVFLPNCFSCYRPPDFAPLVSSLPASRKGYITFGSSNNSCKIHPSTIELWTKILKATGDSHIQLRFRGGNNPEMRERYFRKFAELGVSQERVEIYGWKNFVEHLKSYGEVDIALDTFPWNGHATTCEALWMGVPTISLVGKPFVSRVGLSILSSMGLESFATSTQQEYTSKAISLAGDLETLAQFRASMRERMAVSVLCDAKKFAGNIEHVYQKMWHRWCHKKL